MFSSPKFRFYLSLDRRRFEMLAILEQPRDFPGSKINPLDVLVYSDFHWEAAAGLGIALLELAPIQRSLLPEMDLRMELESITWSQIIG